MTEEKQLNVENWSDFSGEFLKAAFVTKFPLKVFVKDIEASYINDNPVLNIVFEYEGNDKKISLNKTSRNFLIASKVLSPKDIKGKILTFEKIKVRNPKGESVDSFELVKVENGK